METMHFHVRRSYQISFEENFISHSEGPTEQVVMNLKALGVQYRSYLYPSPRLIVFT